VSDSLCHPKNRDADKKPQMGTGIAVTFQLQHSGNCATEVILGLWQRNQMVPSLFSENLGALEPRGRGNNGLCIYRILMAASLRNGEQEQWQPRCVSATSAAGLSPVSPWRNSDWLPLSWEGEYTFLQKASCVQSASQVLVKQWFESLLKDVIQRKA
jgi:hypothetical protein